MSRKMFTSAGFASPRAKIFVVLVRRFGDFNQLQEWDTLTNRVNITDFDDIFAEYDEPTILPEKLDMPTGFASLNNEPSLSATPALELS